MQWRALPGMIKEALADWKEDNAPRLGAALSYYTIFSLAPLLVVTIAIAGLAFGREPAQGRVAHAIGGLVGPAAADAIQTMIAHARKPSAGVIATVIGLVTLLLGATGAFTELKAALNTVWEVEAPAHAGLLGMVRER